MLQRQSNIHKLKTVTVHYLRITGVLFPSIWLTLKPVYAHTNTQNRDPNLHLLLRRKTLSSAWCSTVWLLWLPALSFSPVTFSFTVQCPPLFPDGFLLLPDLFPSCSLFLHCYSAHHSIQTVVLLSFFPLPLDCFFLASSAPVGAFSVISPLAPSLHLAITLLPLDTNPTPSLPSSPFLSLSGSRDGAEYTVQLSLSYSVANDNIFYPIIFFCTPSLWFSLIFTLFFSFNPVHPLPPPYLCLAQKLKPWGFWVPS